PRDFGGTARYDFVAGPPSGVSLACGRRLPVRPRSRSGGRLWADLGGTARRGTPSNRETARGAYASRKTGEADLRYRQSAQSWGELNDLDAGARATRRAQSARGRARQSLNCVRLGAELSHRRCRVVGGGLLGAPARAPLRA